MTTRACHPTTSTAGWRDALASSLVVPGQRLPCRCPLSHTRPPRQPSRATAQYQRRRGRSPTRQRLACRACTVPRCATSARRNDRQTPRRRRSCCSRQAGTCRRRAVPTGVTAWRLARRVEATGRCSCAPRRPTWPTRGSQGCTSQRRRRSAQCSWRGSRRCEALPPRALPRGSPCAPCCHPARLAATLSPRRSHPSARAPKPLVARGGRRWCMPRTATGCGCEPNRAPWTSL